MPSVPPNAFFTGPPSSILAGLVLLVNHFFRGLLIDHLPDLRGHPIKIHGPGPDIRPVPFELLVLMPQAGEEHGIASYFLAKVGLIEGFEKMQAWDGLQSYRPRMPDGL